MARFSGHIGDVDLHLLRVFRTVAECGGVSAAEGVLNVGRSTISRQLSELETRLNLRLCERGPAGFRLTEEGRVVLERAGDLMVSIEGFRRHIHEIHQEIAGTVIVAVADATVPNPKFDLPGAIARLLKKAPGVTVSLRKVSPESMESDLINRRCHLGLKPVLASKKGFFYRHLYDELDLLYCGLRHPLGASKTTCPTLATVRSQDFAALSYDSGFSATLADLKVRPSAYANDLEGLATLILTGRYLGFLPESYGSIFTDRGIMTALNGSRLRYTIPFQAITLAHEEKTIAISLLLNCLEQAAPEVQTPH